jgi:hypothetical protein
MRHASCTPHLARALLAVGEAVGYAVGGIAAGVHRKDSFQFVVSGFVQQIADSNHASYSSAEENQLARGSTLAERPCQGIQLPSSLAQVTMGDAKVHGFERRVAGKQNLVGCIPKVVFSQNLGQILRPGCIAEAEHGEEKTKCSAQSHGPNLRVGRSAAQIT